MELSLEQAMVKVFKATSFSRQPGPKVIHDNGQLMGTIQFDFDNYEISPEFYPVLNKIVQELKNNPSLRIEIRGYTDSTGSEATNKNISDKRAKIVENYVREKGIQKERIISAAGYASKFPVAGNETVEDKARNRRAEVLISPSTIHGNEKE